MERCNISSVLFIHLSYGAWTIGPLESQMRSYIELIKMMMMIKVTKIISGHLIPTHQISLRLRYKDLSANAVYSKGHTKHAYTLGRQNTKLWKIKNVAFTVWECSRDVRQHNPKKNYGRKFLRMKALFERRGIDAKKNVEWWGQIAQY